MRTANELCGEVIMALPNREELAALSDEEIEMLRRAGNTYDNVLYFELDRRRNAAQPSSN